MVFQTIIVAFCLPKIELSFSKIKKRLSSQINGRLALWQDIRFSLRRSGFNSRSQRSKWSSYNSLTAAGIFLRVLRFPRREKPLVLVRYVIRIYPSAIDFGWVRYWVNNNNNKVHKILRKFAVEFLAQYNKTWKD